VLADMKKSKQVTEPLMNCLAMVLAKLLTNAMVTSTLVIGVVD